MRNLIILGLSLFFAVNSFSQEVFDAARAGDVKKMEELWSKDNTILDSKDKNGFTPLILATYRSQVKAVKYLISKKVDLNYNSQEGTALLAATYKGNIEISKMLIENHIDVNIVGGRGATALIYATQSKSLELVKVLLSSKADKSVKDASGKTAHDYAVGLKLKEISALLK